MLYLNACKTFRIQNVVEINFDPRFLQCRLRFQIPDKGSFMVMNQFSVG